VCLGVMEISRNVVLHGAASINRHIPKKKKGGPSPPSSLSHIQHIFLIPTHLQFRSPIQHTWSNACSSAADAAPAPKPGFVAAGTAPAVGWKEEEEEEKEEWVERRTGAAAVEEEEEGEEG
jgi:hypothetical protein